MAPLGHFALVLAFVLSAYSIAASLLGARWKNDRLIASGRNAAISVFAAVTIAILTLGYLFLTDDFSIEYVADHSSRDMAFFYKVAAIWGGQEGSLLFWAWLLTVYAALVVVQNRRKHAAMMPYVNAVMMATALFFMAMVTFVVNPFNELALVAADGTTTPFSARDGAGLNPLLQYVLMVIHPPILYLGFVGFSVPFAFAMAAMMTRQLGDTWIRTTRRWTMVAWFFLGTGILLGGKWAYVELGWGGYWAWDPVENASLMPWLIGTAFLHSVMVQEKKGMMKIWNMVLVIMAYTMCIFGTFLTRSGVVNSVHAFAQSPIGGYFLAYVVIILSTAFYLMFDRISYLKSENTMESFASRESSFMFNNLILLASCFAVFWGTIFPVLSEWVTGEKITLNAPWFNKVNIPIALFLLFLTGVGPVLAWRHTSLNSLKRNFLWPGILSLAAGAVLFAQGARNFYALVSLILCVFVAITIVREFTKGAWARSSSTGENYLEAMMNLTLRNTRRYGGYVVHFGIVVIFVGFAGQAFNTDTQVEVQIGDTIQLKNYLLRIDKLETVEQPAYSSDQAFISVFENGVKTAIMRPERRFYRSSEQPTSEISIKSTLMEDLYVVFAGRSMTDTRKAVIQAYHNPLVMWVWIGGIIVALGTLIALLPNKKPSPSKRERKATSEETESVEEVRAS